MPGKAEIDGACESRFARVMRFTIERGSPLIKTIGLLSGKSGGLKLAADLMTVTACDARVCVEANGVTCGLEALVMREGTCRIPRMSFLKILTLYAPRANITIDAEGGGLQLASTRLAISNYSSAAVPPGRFKTFPVTDDWLVSDAALKPPSANVPAAAPHVSSSGARPRSRIE